MKVRDRANFYVVPPWGIYRESGQGLFAGRRILGTAIRISALNTPLNLIL